MPIPLTTRTRRAGFALLAAGLLATGATACEPPPPPPAFTVIAVETGPDTTPGDGECANVDGRCSLQAAVEEANALDTPTDISVLDGEVAALDLEVTGSIDLTGGDLGLVRFTVVEGAKLVVMDATIHSAVVDGTFATRRAGIGGSDERSQDDALIEVGPTGRVMLTNTSVVAWLAPLAVNDGMLVLHSTTVALASTTSQPAVATITTNDGAETRIAASIFLGDESAVATCAGIAPVSYGHNIAPDQTCGLASPGDQQDVEETALTAQPGSARIDAIPVGTLQCGDGWSDDIEAEDVRPADGDDDATAACDIGADELIVPTP